MTCLKIDSNKFTYLSKITAESLPELRIKYWSLDSQSAILSITHAESPCAALTGKMLVY